MEVLISFLINADTCKVRKIFILPFVCAHGDVCMRSKCMHVGISTHRTRAMCTPVEVHLQKFYTRDNVLRIFDL